MPARLVYTCDAMSCPADIWHDTVLLIRIEDGYGSAAELPRINWYCERHANEMVQTWWGILQDKKGWKMTVNWEGKLLE